MKEIVVLSGKGGTGKTTVTASLAALAKNAVLSDCDVDAADLFLVLNPKIKDTFKFWGGQKALINEDKCTKCGKCQSACRFDAIKNFKVDPTFCEGCGVCYHLCTQKAIDMMDTLSGHWFISETRYGPMVHARLGIAEENSGKLVSLVKKAAREIAQREGYKYIITDGPPGIGCPVISTLSGADEVLMVTEPTAAGLHDLERLLRLTDNFKVTVKMLINKFDLAEEKSREIEQFCIQRGVEVLERIPFDIDMVKAISKGIPPVEYSSGPAAQIIKNIAESIFSE